MTNTSVFCRSRGMTLIEVMIGMTIGIIALLVMQQMVTVFDKQARTSSAGADAQSAAMIAMHLLENDVKAAGYGAASLNTFDCTIRSSIGTINGLPFVPILIIPSGAAVGDPSNQLAIPPGDLGSDMLVVMYGHTPIMPEGKLVTQWSNGAPEKFGVEYTAGLNTGDYLLAAQQGQPCTLGRVSGPTPMASPVELDYPTPAGIAYIQNTANLYHLGAKGLTANVYAVRASRLTVCNMWTSDCTDSTKLMDEAVWTPIANDIVGLRAAYGWDTTSPPDAITDTFCRSRVSGTSPACPSPDSGTAAYPNTPCDWARINTVRIALVAQSREIAERNTGTPITPATIPLWPSSAVAPTTSAVVFSVPDQNYRYKVQQTTVPLRNVIWMGIQASCTS